MQVILLAAGQSARLHPLADKTTLPFCGKTLIERQVDLIKWAKIRDIVVVASPDNAPLLRRLLRGYKNVAVVEQQEDAGVMAAGVLAGAKRVNQSGVLVMSSNDVVETEALEAVKAVFKEKNLDGLMLAKKVDHYFPGGYLKIGKQGTIEKVVEKPGAGKEPSDLVNLVIHAFKDFPAFLVHLKKASGKKDARYEEAINSYIQKGHARLGLALYKGYWQPIKYPWHILRVMEYFLAGQKNYCHKTAQISKQATIRGEGVYIGKDVKIMEHATIVGPAYLDDHVIVANNALVRGSYIGKNCVVGYATEVARSYLQSEVWTHSNYIGDSVIDSNVSFGAGGVTGNLRLDDQEIGVIVGGEKIATGHSKLGAFVGSGSRMGINISLMPGVVVGKNCFVGGGVVVQNNLPDSSFVLAEQRLKFLKNERSATMDNRKEKKKKMGV